MTKQEEIRRGIAHRIQDEADNGYLKHWEETTDLLTLDQRWDYLLKVADLIMGDESRQGVMIKVDRESATCDCCRGTGLIGGSGINDCCPDCNGTGKIYCTGYVAVEPLID